MCKFIISVREILSNFTRAKAYLKPHVKVCAVVKANAYGFGINKICGLLKNHADYFAVARLSEFLSVREVTNKPCLILSPLNKRELNCAIKNGAEISVGQMTDFDFINRIAARYKTKAKVHIKLDTGMNRYGIKSLDALSEVLSKIEENKNIEVIGVFSHLYFAEDKRITMLQRKRFIEMKKLVLSHGFKPIFHIANSTGLKDKDNQFDMVRLGIDLYLNKEHSEHRFTTYISEIKSVEKGETISYSASFKADKPIKIAVCAAGYADGVSRLLSNNGVVLIRGKEAKIVGNVCMDSFMVDISNIDDAELEDEVVIFGSSGERYISPMELATRCKTIPYEIYTNISLRVKRIYTNKKIGDKFWGKRAFKY